jgi:hypothetical protein
MFTTSMTAAVVAGLLASGSLGLPEWTDSYGKAMALAGEKRKPVAVFLTAGDLNTLTSGKGLGEDALKSLKSDYIAVKVDTTTEDGKKVAQAFGISQGVVLSDRTGKQMALKHEGPVTTEQVAGYLTKYATTETIATTEFQSSLVVTQPLVQPQYQPVYQPVQYQQPRPVLNAIQNVGGAIQNVGGVVFSPFVGGS